MTTTESYGIVASMRIHRAALRAFRDKAGLSQTELATTVGITPQALCDLEMGRTKRTTRARVEIMAEALRVPLEALVIFEHEREPVA